MIILLIKQKRYLYIIYVSIILNINLILFFFLSSSPQSSSKSSSFLSEIFSSSRRPLSNISSSSSSRSNSSIISIQSSEISSLFSSSSNSSYKLWGLTRSVFDSYSIFIYDSIIKFKYGFFTFFMCTKFYISETSAWAEFVKFDSTSDEFPIFFKKFLKFWILALKNWFL